MTKYYSGIGSRRTPPDILKAMKSIAAMLSTKGFILRSGGALGADRAFQEGASEGMCNIFRPEHATPEAIKLSSTFHPAWDRCSDYVRKLHGRSSIILLGKKLDVPSKFVVCWTPGGIAVGGTGQGIRMALAHNIPVYNLAEADVLSNMSTIFGEEDSNELGTI